MEIVSMRPFTATAITLAWCLLAASGVRAAGLFVDVGDILTANYFGNKVVRVNPVTGAQETIAGFVAPTDLALAPTGDLYVGELGGAIKRYTITNGALAVVNPASSLTSVRGLTLAPSGDLYVTGRSNAVDLVMRVNSVTGAEAIITQGGNLSLPTGIEILDADHLVVACFSSSTIVKVRIADGFQTVIASGGAFLDRPWGLGVSGDWIYAAHYDSKHINRISASTGASSLLATAPGIPYGVGVDADGNLLVGAVGTLPQQDMLARYSPQGATLSTFSVGLNQQISGIEVSRIQIGEPGTNDPPIVEPIGDTSLDEGTLLSFNVIAYDTNDPPQTLAYSLDPGAPAGAAISDTGLFTWTPGEADGPATHGITVRVTDDGFPPRSAAASFSVVVREVNSAPTVTTILPQSFNEGSLKSFQVVATDPDLPAQTLNFTLGAGSPDGATISPTGMFSWTPSETQGPGSYPVSVIVTDGGSPPLSHTNQFTATVAEVNSAPALAVITNQLVVAGNLLTFAAQATDSDIPAQNLTFSLGPGAPNGAAITANGVFTWTPGLDQAPSTNELTIRVEDNGVPAMSSSRSFSVVVGLPISIAVGDILAVDQVGGTVFRIDAASGAQQRLFDAVFPTDLALSTDGCLYVSEWGGTVKCLNLTNGLVSAVNPGTALTGVWGIVVGPNGKLYLTTEATDSVVELDPDTGDERVLANGGWLFGPYGIAVQDSGHLVVVSQYNGNLVSVSLADGTQSLLLPENTLLYPWGAGLVGSDIYVANYAGQSIERVAGGVATQFYPASPGYPVAVATEANGNILCSMLGLAPNEIVRVSPTGTRLGAFSGGMIGDVYGLEVSTIQVGSVGNRPPVPSSPSVESPSSCSLKLRAQDLLGNDPDGDPLTLNSLDPGSLQGGAVTLLEGWVRYVPPAAGLTNNDTFGYTVSDGHGNISAGVVTIIPVPDLAVSLNVATAPAPGGGVRITGSGIPQRVYTVEYTENLQTGPWLPLGNVTADISGVFEYTDTPPGGSPARFYRTWTSCQ